jgi:hypothetical protein
MSSANLPLCSRGIYHNLPTFPPQPSPLTAIVTGTNGISGFHTMRVLLESPERWQKVYAISRRPPLPEMMALLPAEAKGRVEHVACDFLDDPKEIAQKIRDKGVTKVDAVFFYSYLQPKTEEGESAWSNAEALVQTNCMFRLVLFLVYSPIVYSCVGEYPPACLSDSQKLTLHLAYKQLPSSLTSSPPSTMPLFNPNASFSKLAPKITGSISGQSRLLPSNLTRASLLNQTSITRRKIFSLTIAEGTQAQVGI